MPFYSCAAALHSPTHPSPTKSHLRKHSELRFCGRVVKEPAVLDAVSHSVPPRIVVQLYECGPAAGVCVWGGGGGGAAGGRGC